LPRGRFGRAVRLPLQAFDSRNAVARIRRRVMDMPTSHGPRLSRRAILRAGSSTVLGAAATAMLPGSTRGARLRTPAAAGAAAPGAQDAASLFRALDAKIGAAMAQYHIPGV